MKKLIILIFVICFSACEGEVINESSTTNVVPDEINYCLEPTVYESGFVLDFFETPSGDTLEFFSDGTFEALIDGKELEGQYLSPEFVDQPTPNFETYRIKITICNDDFYIPGGDDACDMEKITVAPGDIYIDFKDCSYLTATYGSTLRNMWKNY